MNAVIIPQFTKLISSSFFILRSNGLYLVRPPIYFFFCIFCIILQLYSISLSVIKARSVIQMNSTFALPISPHKTDKTIQKFDKQRSLKYSIKIDKLANTTVFSLLLYPILLSQFSLNLIYITGLSAVKDRKIDAITKSTWVTVCSTCA